MTGRRIAVLLLAALTLVAAGCGGDDANEAADDTETAVVEDSGTPTESDDSATETEDAADDSGTGALTGECAAFAGLSAKLSQAFAGSSSDLDSATEIFDEVADQVPEEIRDDYEVLANNIEEFADELKELDLAAGETPSPEDIAKLQEIAQSLDSAEVREASQNLEAWAQANC
jgi:hypothetical protein